MSSFTSAQRWGGMVPKTSPPIQPCPLPHRFLGVCGYWLWCTVGRRVFRHSWGTESSLRASQLLFLPWIPPWAAEKKTLGPSDFCNKGPFIPAQRWIRDLTAGSEVHKDLPLFNKSMSQGFSSQIQGLSWWMILVLNNMHRIGDSIEVHWLLALYFRSPIS